MAGAKNLSHTVVRNIVQLTESTPAVAKRYEVSLLPK
jgi:hypothetical protein